MTTRDISLNAFSLNARQGRTRQPLKILGVETLVKVANTDTDGAVRSSSRPCLHWLDLLCIASPPKTNGCTSWRVRSQRKSTASEAFFKREVRRSGNRPVTRLQRSCESSFRFCYKTAISDACQRDAA